MQPVCDHMILQIWETCVRNLGWFWYLISDFIYLSLEGEQRIGYLCLM